MNADARLKRLKFRSWHRGVREADLMLGGFFDARHAGWAEEEISWFEALLEEQDVDIMAWAIGTEAVPARWAGAMMDDLRRMDFVPTPE